MIEGRFPRRAALLVSMLASVCLDSLKVFDIRVKKDGLCVPEQSKQEREARRVINLASERSCSLSVEQLVNLLPQLPSQSYFSSERARYCRPVGGEKSPILF